MKELQIAVALLLLASMTTAQEKAAGGGGGGLPRITHLGTVAPDIICVKVMARHVEYGTQVPYERREGDTIQDPEHHRWVMREGKCLGSLVGSKGRTLYTLDRVVGRRLDTQWASSKESYIIASRDDARYAGGASPLQVHRKTKPSDLARVGPWAWESPTEHVLYLKLPRPLAVGKTYTLTFNGGPFEPQTFVHAPERQRSDAVHVSHLGFRPDDPAKVAFLSCWMGDGGPLKYPDGLPFRVLDDDTGKSELEGKLTLSKAADDMSEDAYKTNHNKTDVFEADFSSLRRPGAYRVYVDGIGCSYAFRIADDVWRDAFFVSARGFYHQRSGIELGPPYTSYRRPRCFHPDDGVNVYASTAALMDTGNGLNRKDSNFANLVKGKTDEIVPNAWGGYMDAGDWDRRIQHLKASELLLDLDELFPDYFGKLSLNIPESDDGLPDVVSEALFNLDCYRRMQTADGGIRGGIESSEHPRHGEASWQESLTIMAYAPGVWSSYVYAGVAARAGRILQGMGSDRGRVYLGSALAAMKWAEKELPGRAGKNDPDAVKDARNLAAAELFRATGDAAWHRIFLETTALTDPKAELFKWQDHEQGEAAWVYARTEQPGMDERVKENCRRAITKEADARVAMCQKTGFRWTKYEWRPTGAGSLSAPDAVTLVRAHFLTGEEKYLRAAVLACQTGAGANPVNICYTTGLGHKSPKHPLHIDSRISGQPPPPGLTVFGPLNPKQMAQDWAQKLIDRECYPPSSEWPIIEAYWDVFWYPMMCEFTVQQPMAANAYVWGYLAARPAD